MVNKFGVHVGVGEVGAASVPAERKTAIASITGKIATVRVCMTFSISRPVYQTRLPRSSSRSLRGAHASRVLASASSRSRTFSQRRVNRLQLQELEASSRSKNRYDGRRCIKL